MRKPGQTIGSCVYESLEKFRRDEWEDRKRSLTLFGVLIHYIGLEFV